MAIEYRKIDEKPKMAKVVESVKQQVARVEADIADIPKNPKSDKNKKATYIRFDPKVMQFFRATGPGWQTRINTVLLDYVDRQIQGGK